MDHASNTSPWGEYRIENGQTRCFALGPLQVWCLRKRDEVWIAFKREIEGAPRPAEESPEPPADLAWSRWTVGRDGESIRILPLFPDRPVIVTPESPFRMVPHARSRIYVRVPLWLRVALIGRAAVTLAEIPTVILSDTWFGDFTTGELCYWISSGARTESTPDPVRPYLALCPIQVVNHSEEELLVEKICLRVGGLTLYEHAGQLWSDDYSVTQRGADVASRVDIAGRPPAECPTARLISPPRTPIGHGLTAKTFASLKELPGIGYFVSQVL